jgi:hypothetical protein
MFEDDPEMARTISEAKELEIQNRVGVIMKIIENENFFEKYDPSKDGPEVLLALNRAIHDQILTENKQMIAVFNIWLQKSAQTIEDNTSSQLLSQLK